MEALNFVIYIIAILALLLLAYFYRQYLLLKNEVNQKSVGNIAKDDSSSGKIKVIERTSFEKEVESKLEQARKEADEIIKRAKEEYAARQKSLAKLEESVLHREEILNKRLKNLHQKEKQVEEYLQKVSQMKDELEMQRLKMKEEESKIQQKLQEIANLNSEQARKLILEETRERLKKEIAHEIRLFNEKLQKEKDSIAQEIIIDSMTSAATDLIGEYTTSLFYVGGEEVKGRIIGKEGRNIKAFNRLTGVELVIDEGDEYIMISCFDPLRRELAKIALTRLLKDGRINPARIEEEVNKARIELSKQIIKDGEEIAYKAGFSNLTLEQLKYLGRMKYRFSYGQCLATHVLEVVNFVAKAAAELKLDVNLAKECALWHDIGKVVTHEKEGDHMQLGEEIGIKLGLRPEVINAMYAHHMARDPICMESALVYIADANSAARPGARYGSEEDYVKRIKTLEEIAKQYEGVKEAYAVEAGREVRVFVDPVIINDDDIIIMSNEIAQRIRESTTYPGIIKVTVIREVRAIATSR